MGDLVLIDISNSFTKVAVARRGVIGAVKRLPTASLDAAGLQAAVGRCRPAGCVAASVVPSKNGEVEAAFGPEVCWTGPKVDLGVGIDYPSPGRIGADRLANAAACVALHGVPAIVVDFGTAVTFDVVCRERGYIGGVIAPGLNAMTEYLHDRTALLPLIRLREPRGAVGRSTEQAMLSGAVHGYRGLVKEILTRIRREEFPKRRPVVVATGGDARLISAGLPLFDVVDPLLTLRGLLVIGGRNLSAADGETPRRRAASKTRSGRRGAR